MPVFLEAVLIAGGAATLRAGTDPAMVEADRAFTQALSRADQPALERLLDGDFTWTDFRGKRQTRAQVLRHLPKAAIADEKAAEARQFGYGNLGDVQVNVGRAHVLRVWVKRPGGWKAIVYQEVRSLDAAPAFTPGAGKVVRIRASPSPIDQRMRPGGR